MGKLDGRVAVVTGAGRGIGRGIALCLAKEGAKVVVASRTQARVDEVVEEIMSAGQEAAGISVDVGDRAQVERMVAEAVDRFGGLDILVNNAQSWGLPGAQDVSPPMWAVELFPEDEWDYMFQTGLKATLYGMQAAFPQLSKSGFGRVINFGSPGAQSGMPFQAAYSANKEAIRSLTRTTANEWGKYGITVNCISPAIMTEAGRGVIEAMSGGDPSAEAEMLKSALDRIPMGRIGEPERDAGALAAFIASDDASYLTGMTFMLDGGMTPR
jgi:NAD(P)-dependent dehydrogenase (short-subunit alcohol dehydrogenase family)